MTRSARAAVGGVVVLVLLLVAAVSGLVAAVASAQVRDGYADGGEVESQPQTDWFVDPVTVQAEVLDVDGGPEEGWLSVDVTFGTEDGGREVVTVDLGEQGEGSPPPPEVGDTVEVVHERDDPGYALSSGDPVLTGQVVDDVPDLDAEETREAGEEVVGRTRALALGSLLLAVLVTVLTVVAVRRAPPVKGWAEPTGSPPPGAQQSGVASSSAG